MTYHQILAFSAFLTGIWGIFLGAVDTDILRGVGIFFMSMFYIQISIIANLAVIEGFRHDGLNGWLQVNHGAYGVGGLIGPLFIKYLQQKAYILFGGLMILHCFLYFKLPSPEVVARREEASVPE